jgi:hypothetical protein
VAPVTRPHVSTAEEGSAMKEYTVVIGGIEHTMQLDADDAKRLGATEAKAAEAPANKSRTAKNKS